MIQMLVDLTTSTVLDEETAEDSEATHPKDLTINQGVSALNYTFNWTKATRNKIC
jgi:hypothetical protein